MTIQKTTMREKIALQLFHRDEFIEAANTAFENAHHSAGMIGKMRHWSYAIILWLRHTPKAAFRELCVHLFHDPSATQRQYEKYVQENPPHGLLGKIRCWIMAWKLYHTWKKAQELNICSTQSTGNGFAPSNNWDPVCESADSSIRHFPKGRTPLHMASYLSQFDVISFDIFDTLLLRPFRSPVDLFYLIEARLGIPYGAIRTNAEKDARDIEEARSGSREVKLDDICKIVAQRCSLSKEQAIQIELDAEKEFCMPNPYMKKVFDILKANGKKIILVSDMYIPEDQMRELLAACGYEGYTKLYVSCDHGVSKRGGKLYDIVKADFADQKIIHIGDNPASDWKSAKDAGLETVEYHNVNEQGQRFRPIGMSRLIGSAYAGLVNATLHNGMRQYDPAYEFGFAYAGLYITGFCAWLKKRMDELGLEKLLFLARDGDIYRKVFSRMYPGVPIEYVHWSRMAAMRFCTAENKYEFITRMVIYRARDLHPSTIEAVLASYGLTVLAPMIEAAGHHMQDLLTGENCDAIAAIFSENWSLIDETYAAERKAYADILRTQIGNARSLGIVDVGWAGSGPLCTSDLIRRELDGEYRIHGFMAGSSTTTYTATEGAILRGDLDVYMFSVVENTDLYKIQHLTNKAVNCLIFEMFTQTDHPSFRGIEADGSFDFVIPEAENYQTIRKIHQGILDFNKLWCRTFANTPFMLNISGRDAYIPFAGFISNTNLVRRDFEDFVAVRNVGVDEKNASFATMEDHLKSVGLA